MSERSRRPRSRKTEGRGGLKFSDWKRGATSNSRWKLVDRFKKKRKALLPTPLDETEIESDCLRHPPQKDGDSRQEITLNRSLVCSPLTNEKLWTSGNEQGIALLLIILNYAKWKHFQNVIFLFRVMFRVTWKLMLGFSSLCWNPTKATGTFPGSI